MIFGGKFFRSFVLCASVLVAAATPAAAQVCQFFQGCTGNNAFANRGIVYSNGVKLLESPSLKWDEATFQLWLKGSLLLYGETWGRIGLRAPATGGDGTIFTLPASHCNAGQVWVDNGSGVFSCGDMAVGSGTVTSVATTSPISGGTFTTSGTISCPTCAIGPGTSTANHLAKFSGTDGLTLTDGGAIPAGTVTSVSTSAPVTGCSSPCTSTATIGVSDFVASGSSHASGTVPDPGASAGTTKFLREDATWVVPAVGIVQLGTATLGTDQQTLATFSGIPDTYNDLRLVIVGRTDQTTGQIAGVRFNNDTNTNYTYQQIYNSSGTVLSASGAVTQAVGFAIFLATATANANAFSSMVVEIPNYRGTTFQKSWVSKGYHLNAADGSGEGTLLSIVGRWKNTAAIDQIDVYVATGKFKAGSYCTLYGLGSH